MDVAQFLKAVPPFDALDDHTLEALRPHTRITRHKKREVIVRAGEPGETMYIIVEGLVLVKVTDEEGRERHVCWLGPREMFGEMALVTGELRTADVVAEKVTTCVAVDRAPFQALMQYDHSVAAFLTELVGRRLLEGGQIDRVGKYRVLHELGRGGMGTVFAGYHEALRRPVALKMLNHELVLDPVFARRFDEEAELVASLQHPGIVQVYDHEHAYATHFIVMELLRGETLAVVMARERQLEEGFVRRVIHQLASALAYAHACGITHRDVKPENVMLPDGKPAKLMDFGIAGPMGDPDDGGPIGTPAYMSPEQMRGEGQDARTDIYALGVMAYEMLTGDLPFYDDDVDVLMAMKSNQPFPAVRDYRPAVSDSMVEFIARACAADPVNRFASCDEVVAHLGDPPNLSLRGRLRGRNVTLLYDQRAEHAVQDALDRLAGALAREPVVISVAKHGDLKRIV